MSNSTPIALYRASGVGQAFVESLQEMFREQEMNQDQFSSAMAIFDRTVNDGLAEKPVNGITLDGSVSAYRYDASRVWTLLIKNAVLSSPEGIIETPHLKILACEARSRPRKPAAANASQVKEDKSATE